MTFHLNRRSFLGASAAGAAAFISAPVRARPCDLNGKLRVAAVGTGNKGRSDLEQVASSPLVEVRHALDPDDCDRVNVSPEYFPELLAGASLCLATSLEQIALAANAGVSEEQRRAADLLNQALKLVHEAAALDVHTTA